MYLVIQINRLSSAIVLLPVITEALESNFKLGAFQENNSLSVLLFTRLSSGLLNSSRCFAQKTELISFTSPVQQLHTPPIQKARYRITGSSGL